MLAVYLCNFRRLADMDHDNALSEQEFCVAMKLVLLRRKGYSLPTTLPLSLRESIAGESCTLSTDGNRNPQFYVQEITTAKLYLQCYLASWSLNYSQSNHTHLSQKPM